MYLLFFYVFYIIKYTIKKICSKVIRLCGVLLEFLGRRGEGEIFVKKKEGGRTQNDPVTSRSRVWPKGGNVHGLSNP